MPHRLLIPTALLLLFALHAPAAPPATRPSTTRPATTTAATSPSEDDKRVAELDALLARVLPKEVIDGKKEPTEEQKALMQMFMVLGLGSNKTPDRIKEADENRQKGRDKLAAVEKAADELRKENAGKSAAMRDEANKAADAQVRTVRLFNEMTDAPVTADATEEKIADRAYDRARKLPQRVRDLTVATLEAKYHGQRLDLLQKIDDFRHQATTQPANSEPRRLAEQQAAAYEALLKAIDAKYEAQQQILKLTPLGQLSDSIIE